MRRRFFPAAVLMLFVLVPVFGGGLGLSGYAKGFFMFSGGEDGGGSLLQKVRISPRLYAYPFDLSLSYELMSRYSGFREESVAQRYRAADPERKIFESGDIAIYQNIDRCFVTWYSPAGDIYAGRQPVSWGSARIINPTDILIPVSYAELDKEERAGVDAVRARVPLGAMSELDAGMVFGEGFDSAKGACFMRVRGYFFETDAVLLGMRYLGNTMAGIDLERSAGDAGFRIEAAFHKIEGEDDYYRISAGFDGNVSEKIYGVIEYHYSSAGEKEAGDYALNIDKSAFTEGGVYLNARNYLCAMASWQAAGLVSVAVTSVFNMDDLSLSSIPVIEYNPAEDVYVSAGAYLYGGLEGEGEFRDTAGTVYVSVRYYF